MLGSSPRMRGTLFLFESALPIAGIIPAYAGNTLSARRIHRRPEDHPRVCGEHIEYKIEGATSQGSSPRMRGTPSRVRKAVKGHGIIPAYAGNTFCYVDQLFVCGDHPRVCGEHIAGKMRVLAEKGSSPRMRGTRWYWTRWPNCPGIIPAYAGNTSTNNPNLP